MNTAPKSYVLLSEYNDYGQYGAYFVAWFHRKPTLEELRTALQTDGELSPMADYNGLAYHVLDGGGRRGSEHVWYALKKVESSSTP